ncbi:hypothetical protein AB0E69_14380 [Kribbella sp. NPDC026611]|uniref:hypothetical protein n=1 Tax=Kribbella sp. NPDC026611 TaxID=3154911 RepID=UPI0033CE73DD
MSDQQNAVVRRGAAELRGIAQNVQYRSEGRSENGSIQVLTFRLAQQDSVGTPQQPVLVELRATALEGQVVDGEDVTVTGKWRSGRVVAKEIVSQTTGAAVRARRPPLWVAVPVAILFAAFFAVVLYFIIRGFSSFGG